MIWNNLSVARKLWGVVLGALAMMLALGVAVLVYVEHIDARSRQAIEAADARIGTTMQWKSLTELSTERFLVSATSTERHLVEEMALLSRQNSQQINGLQKQIEDSASEPQERALVQRLAANREQFREVAMGIFREREAGNTQAALALVQQRLRPTTSAYIGMLGELVGLQEQQRDAMAAQARQQRQRAYLAAGGATLALLCAGILLSALLVRSITRPLARAVALADAIAAGDLTQDAPDARRDELGQLLRALSAMAQRLRGVVGQVRAGVESVSSASSQIASGNQDLSARTEQTAANLQQTAASMEQLTATVGQSAETARQANQLAVRAAQAAEQGGHMVGQVVASMQRITTSSRQIADIIQVIDSIAFQTNILALNAAVEAARAGEQGRGFAVVAGEVRSLAQRSAEAAKEIKQLIGASVDSVQAGSAQVEQAGQGMHGIVEGVRRVGELIAEITASSSEQANGIGQVNQAVAQLDQMTQQNAALVEQSSAAAAAMHEQAQRLAQVVAVFNVGAADSQTAAAVATTAALARARAQDARPARAAATGLQPVAGVQLAPPAHTAAPSAAALRTAASARVALAASAATAGVQGDDWESF